MSIGPVGGASWRPLHFLWFFFLAAGCATVKQTAGVPVSPLHAAPPAFVAQNPNPNDYALFANSGWDGNWYVGWNNGWVKKLPPIPSGRYAHAYIGAKLGRMKLLPPVGRPPKFSPIPGEIWMALASTPSWRTDQKVLLATTDDIPLESSAEYALENTGEAQWFWREVPLDSVARTGDNFVAIWSTTSALTSVSSAPVLAAAWGGKEVNAWLAKDLKGDAPPDSRTALSTGISYFQPALALKLIPAGDPPPMHLRVLSWHNGTADHPRPVIVGSVEGESVERVWVEYSAPVHHGDVVKGHWLQVGRSLWKAPYAFSLDQEKLTPGNIYLRLAAVNMWEEYAYSDPFKIEVSPLHAKN